MRLLVHFRILIAVCAAWAALVLFPAMARAGVRLENICQIYGQREVKLTGVGLVVGLNGTGDGGDNLPAMRALASALRLMNSPVLDLRELKDADNVAMVFLEARIPKTGLRKGQRLDLRVNSFMGAKSLRGGRLLIAPMETADISDDTLVGLASGGIYVDDSENLRTGRIPDGVTLEIDFPAQFIDPGDGGTVSLVLDKAHSSFHATSEIARLINQEFSFVAEGKQLAHAVGLGRVEVQIPPQYHEYPVEFIAEMFEVQIERPQRQGRVVVDSRSGTVIVGADVEISPVIITHKNLTVEIMPLDPTLANPGRFVAIDPQAAEQQVPRLQHLLDALNKLRVPPQEVISILRQLHRSGNLHAIYEEY